VVDAAAVVPLSVAAADVVVADVVVAVVVDDAVPFVVFVLLLLFVLIGLIAELLFVGGAAGLNGVFCFCILYIRLGHNVTRISRPNNSFPTEKHKRNCFLKKTMKIDFIPLK